MFDFSVVEKLIVDRIVAIAQTGPNAWARLVGTRKHLQDIAEEMQTVPGVYVVYDGFGVVTSSAFDAHLQHRWLVVLAVGNAASQKDAAAINADAGPLLEALIHGLHGYPLPSQGVELVIDTPPRPYYSPSRFAYFPLVFTHESNHCTSS